MKRDLEKVRRYAIFNIKEPWWSVFRNGCRRTASQKWEVLLIKLVFDGVFGNVLKDWSPARHLVRLLSDALFTRYLMNFLAVALERYLN